jgi:radical SAM superfamily enzyme YgiQ (UPF0313 family)
MTLRRQICPEKIAAELLTTASLNAFRQAKETIAGLNVLELRDAKPGQSLSGKQNSEIRIALIRPLGTLSGGEEKEAVREMGEPYQLELLASVLISKGYQIRIFDQLAAPFDPDNPAAYPSTKPLREFVSEIAEWNPDVVCCSTFTYNFRNGLTIASAVKEKIGMPVVFGGYHTTSVGRQYLLFDSLSHINPEGADVFKEDLRFVFQHGVVDYACIGEGTHTISDIMEVLKGKKDADEVSGIAFMDGSRLHVSPSIRLELDDHPLPFRHPGFNPMMYYATGRNYPFLLLLTSTGCRYGCTYCSTGVNYPGLKFRESMSVVRELSIVKQQFRPGWPGAKIMINIFDEDFGASPTRVVELCNAISASSDMAGCFRFNSFMDNRTILSPNGSAMLKAMHMAGFIFCFVGIESMLDSAVAGYERPDRFEDRLHKIQAAIDRMDDNHVLYFGDHMAGYPDHTIDDIMDDYQLVLDLRRMLYAYFPIVAPMPGTPLYWQVILGKLGEGIFPGITYDQFDANHQVVQINGGGNVKALRDGFVQEFFARSEYEEDAVRLVTTNPVAGLEIVNLVRRVADNFPDNSALASLAGRLRELLP